ncbi:hypothetical protein [Candidatus Thiothrix anitrata]|uniref:HD Cas3-type domain-containing protein n=1 Tax=Candidatus Thiothrix anitrata TaxID=2823902 RepID=A0ABX7X4I0_9GAMM|nr:hypothetical protein [Candidatus Thiothrix anitrata]QTR49723.1 hypothetical protein J8380_16065 [Candidatus Thiothrix anitrata]
MIHPQVSVQLLVGKVKFCLTLQQVLLTVAKHDMGKLDKYKGLFAEQGDLDMPAATTVGIAWQATPKTSDCSGCSDILNILM